MSQRSLSGETVDDENTCGPAVQAALKAIEEHCGEGKVPKQMDNGEVVMVPSEEHDRVKQANPDEMSDEEVMAEVRDSEFLDEWTDGMCTNAGLERGTRRYQQCRLNFARSALD